jgi:signal transduction histidine kinase
MPSPAAQDPHRSDEARQLAERARAGFVLIIVAVVGFAAADLAVNRHVIAPLLCIAAFQIVAAGAGVVALRGAPSWIDAVVVPIAVLGAVFVSGAVSDVISRNLYATSLMGMAASLVTASFFPWGVWPQALATTLMTGASVGGLVKIGGSFGAVGHLATGCTAIAGASVLIAHAFERGRIDRADANAALASSKADAEEEAQVASVLVRIGETLGAKLGKPDMLAAVSTLARDAIGSDWTSTFIWDDQHSTLRFAANTGSRPEIVEALRDVAWTVGSMPLVGTVRAGTLLEIPDAMNQRLVPLDFMRRMETASVLFAPITAGGTVLGTQLYGYVTRSGAFTPRQRRLALGIAHSTAIALENARLIDRLQAASRLKTEFVATMSHELRTPLNVITGYTDMLLEGAVGETPPAQREMLLRIQQSSVELFDLVTATLDVGRLEAGRETVDRAPVELRALVAELGREVAPLVANGVTLHWDLDVGMAVLTDRTKIKTILKNLVGNALKFTRTGTVTVSAAWRADLLTLTVRDTGVGIPADALPVIFEMFRQVDGSDSRRYGGVGLGLHIVQRLVTLLGGTVDVSSRVGVGSTFTVRIPAQIALRATGT